MHPLFHAFFAQTAPDGGSPGTMQFLFPLVLIFGVFYFLVIRPQSKQQKQHQSYVSGLKKGDDVVTQGGIVGKVVSVDDRTVTIDAGAGTKLRVLKANVAGAWVEKPAGGKADAAEAEAKK